MSLCHRTSQQWRLKMPPQGFLDQASTSGEDLAYQCASQSQQAMLLKTKQVYSSDVVPFGLELYLALWNF